MRKVKVRRIDKDTRLKDVLKNDDITFLTNEIFDLVNILDELSYDGCREDYDDDLYYGIENIISNFKLSKVKKKKKTKLKVKLCDKCVDAKLEIDTKKVAMKIVGSLIDKWNK